MSKLQVHRTTITLIIIFVAVSFMLANNWLMLLRQAHSSFESYFAFRGCTELLEKTDHYGLCKDSSGQTIMIVTYDGKWYLDGDLPHCWFFNMCID